MASSRTALLALSREPRAAPGTVVTLLVAPDAPTADAAMLFVSNEDLVPFSGDALMAATFIAVERGLILPRREAQLEIDTLAGPVFVASRGRAVSFTGPAATVIRANHA